MGQERFYVAEIPFRGVTYKKDTVIFNTKATALYWSGINIKVKSDDKQILSVKSSPTILKDMVMPFGALFVNIHDYFSHLERTFQKILQNHTK